MVKLNIIHYMHMQNTCLSEQSPLMVYLAAEPLGMKTAARDRKKRLLFFIRHFFRVK